MKLDPYILSYIQNAINVAEMMGIDFLIMEKDMLRGQDEHTTIFILHTKDVPDLPFGAAGLTRLSVLSSRLSLVKNLDKFEVEAIVQEDADKKPLFARSLVLKGVGAKVDYRCHNPALMKSPRTTNQEFAYKMQMSPEAVAMIKKGQAAMASDEVTLIGTDDGVALEMIDDNGDSLLYKFADRVEYLGDDDEEGNPIDFSHKYPAKHLLALFKNNSDSDFYLTPRGILKTTVSGLDVYILHKE